MATVKESARKYWPEEVVDCQTDIGDHLCANKKKLHNKGNVSLRGNNIEA